MYNYENEKQNIFTDEGQRMFLQIREHIREIVDQYEVITMNKAMSGSTGGGSSWTMMACVDRMVELGELEEVEQCGYVAGQHKIYRSLF